MHLAVFASGGGSNFQSVLDAIHAGTLQARVTLCVSNKATAGALVRAEENGIPCLVLDPNSFGDESSYEAVLLAALSEHGVTHIALAGYLRRIPSGVVAAFRWRIVNIHPALLPAYGGPGMYGRHVHEAVIAAKDAFSGATVHFVDEEYDTGPIVLQEAVPILPGDDPEALAARVLRAEHRLYPAALQLLSEGRIQPQGRRVLIDPTPLPTP
ncbi:MAG: phosphoribosylglycinamide formyltransferase-1 [Rhodothermales bacterium]|jgi:phosphoribosylglycinamide formyltransferase-1